MEFIEDYVVTEYNIELLELKEKKKKKAKMPKQIITTSQEIPRDPLTGKPLIKPRIPEKKPPTPVQRGGTRY